jgi:hypothetical protein
MFTNVSEERAAFEFKSEDLKREATYFPETLGTICQIVRCQPRKL